jgi:hypothetical protein
MFFVFAATSVNAQGKVVKVAVDGGSDKPSQEMAELVRGKVGSTLRYALTEIKTANIAIDIVCIDVPALNGIACTAPTQYYPDLKNSLYRSLPDSIWTGSRAYVAQSIFDTFVEQTTDEKLSVLAQSLEDGTAKAWMNGYNLGEYAGKKECLPELKPAPTK